MTLLSQNGQPPEAGMRSDTSVGELTAQVGELTARLVRDELALAQAEARQRAKRVSYGVGAFGFAGLLAFLSACCAVAAAVIGLAGVIRPWLAALVVGAVLMSVAGLTVLPGWKGITGRRPDVPHDSVESVKADLNAVREAVKR